MHMDGLLIVDKPAGMTSHDVVARLRRILKTKKIGHTGTLDPFATGVMAVLVGRATRLAQFLDKDQKEYDLLVKFGYETDTGDRTGNRRERDPNYQPRTITPDDLIRVISNYMGEISQMPPMYSAKKIDGQKLYELARRGEEVARQPIDATIFKIELSQDNLPVEVEPETFHLRFRVISSAGTYMRTLAEDIGRDLGPGAHLEELRRMRSGRFGIEQAVTLEELENAEDPETYLLPVEEAVSHLPEFVLEEDRVDKTLNGLPSRTNDAEFEDGESVKMMSPDGRLIAIGTYSASEKTIHPGVVIG
jgi:tRNA pseudouridine55 synthase